MSAKLIQVIETDICRGAGTAEAPFRTVMQYHWPDGRFLTEIDPNALIDSNAAMNHAEPWKQAVCLLQQQINMLAETVKNVRCLARNSRG